MDASATTALEESKGDAGRADGEDCEAGAWGADDIGGEVDWGDEHALRVAPHSSSSLSNMDASATTAQEEAKDEAGSAGDGTGETGEETAEDPGEEGDVCDEPGRETVPRVEAASTVSSSESNIPHS